MKGFGFAWIGLLIGLIIALLGGDSALAQPSSCYRIEGQRVCLVDIQRSAKNYWEYRTVISVDGKKQPAVTYNCRDRTQTTADRRVVPFNSASVGQLICRFFRRR